MSSPKKLRLFPIFDLTLVTSLVVCAQTLDTIKLLVPDASVCFLFYFFNDDEAYALLPGGMRAGFRRVVLFK